MFLKDLSKIRNLKMKKKTFWLPNISERTNQGVLKLQNFGTNSVNSLFFVLLLKITVKAFL